MKSKKSVFEFNLISSKFYFSKDKVKIDTFFSVPFQDKYRDLYPNTTYLSELIYFLTAKYRRFFTHIYILRLFIQYH